MEGAKSFGLLDILSTDENLFYSKNGSSWDNWSWVLGIFWARWHFGKMTYSKMSCWENASLKLVKSKCLLEKCQPEEMLTW